MKNDNRYDYVDYFQTIMAWCMQERDMLNYAITNISDLDMKKHYELMHNVESTADDLRRDMIKHLLKDFIPLFEREDIMELSKLMEDVIDSIEKIFKLIRIYNLRTFDKITYKQLDILNKVVDAVAKVIDELENFKINEEINDLIHCAMKIESIADEIYLDGLTELFEKGEGNIFNVLPRKELIQAFEDAINSCEKVAYFIEVVQINNL